MVLFSVILCFLQDNLISICHCYVDRQFIDKNWNSFYACCACLMILFDDDSLISCCQRLFFSLVIITLHAISVSDADMLQNFSRHALLMTF